MHTAKRIYDRLVSEKGFTGSNSIVCRVVHEMKAQYVPAQADVPLEYTPGDAIQIDWGEATIYLRGERKVVQIFCGRLCYSCDIFVMACLDQNAESFLEAQQRMFDHFGEVPRRLIFDNGKVAEYSLEALVSCQSGIPGLFPCMGTEAVFHWNLTVVEDYSPWDSAKILEYPNQSI